MTEDTRPTVDDEAEDDNELDEEDLGSGPNRSTKPWEPKKIRITTKSFTLREIVEQIREREVDLAPDFQREFVWKARQRTRLVESILLGIPLPAFYFNQSSDGAYQVVDGVQRLWTVWHFVQNEHVLDANDLEYLRDLAGRRFDQLDPATQRRFRGTQIVVHVIEPQTPDDVKYDIFSRVNTLGSPLSSQEIRHAMSKERSRWFLARLVHLPSFDLATAGRFWRSANGESQRARVRDSRRMLDRELALRFCAFRSYEEIEYKQHESLDAYLVAFTRQLDGRSDEQSNFDDPELDTLAAEFDRAMQNASLVLGSGAFRRWAPGSGRRGPLNRAVFESQAVALADYTQEQLAPHREPLVAAFRDAFNEPDYLDAVIVGTGDPTKVSLRLERTRRILAEIVR